MIPVFCPTGQGQLSAASSGSPIAGYRAWYNPSTIQQTAGIVTAWNDASANAYHLTTPSGLPTYVSSAINGQAGVGFASASSQSIANSVAISNYMSAAAWTIYAVFSATTFTGSNNANYQSGGSIFSDSALFIALGSGTTASKKIVAGDTGTPATIASGVVSAGLFIVEFYFDGTNINLRTNGTGATPVANANLSNLTHDIQVGVAGAYFNGTMCELVFYNTTLSSSNRTTMHSYLGTKYGGTG